MRGIGTVGNTAADLAVRPVRRRHGRDDPTGEGRISFNQTMNFCLMF